MTYETTSGERVLRGAERDLIGGAAWILTDDIRTLSSSGYSLQLGIGLFDRLTWQQQIVLIDRVLSYMLDESIPAPPRTAMLDATIAAIYAQLLARLECEIDMERYPVEMQHEEEIHPLRQEVLNALLEHDPDQDWPDVGCCEQDSWELAVESLQELVLADQDWAMDDLTMDLSPERGQELKQVMGISDDYYIDVPPEATDQQAKDSWANIILRVTGARPSQNIF